MKHSVYPDQGLHCFHVGNTMKVLISWLHQKPAGQGLHCFQKWKEFLKSSSTHVHSALIRMNTVFQ